MPAAKLAATVTADRKRHLASAADLLSRLRALEDGDQLEVLAIVIQAWVYAQQNPSYLDYLRRNA